MTTTAATTFDELRHRYQQALQPALVRQVARLGWSREQIEAHQQTELRRLLAHAQAHSPFHARRLAGIDPARVTLPDLPALPTMTKQDLMESFDDVVTDRRLTRTAVEAHLATCIERPEFFAGEYLCIASGGSSGTRGVFVLDWDAAVTMVAAVLAPGPGRMSAAGAGPPPGLVVGVVAAPAAIHATRAGTALIDGGLGRVVHAPVTLPVPEIVRRLNEAQPGLLVSYPTMLSRLAGEQRAGRLAIAPRMIVVTSEQLQPATATDATSTFGAPVANSFGSSEGLYGSSEPGEEAIAFATDLAIVELVDDQNRPVLPGTPSSKVLLTNLSNLAQPLIRYELSDSFIRHPDAATHGHLRATVEGRTDHAFTYGDVIIHPLVLRSPLVAATSVTEYQVRQTQSGVEVSLVTVAPVDHTSLRLELERALEAAGLAGAEVTVRVVARIERHAETGKARRFISL